MRLLFERLDGLRVGVDEQAALAGDQIKYAKETALMLASERGFINVVELLLGKQVLASAVNREGKNFIFKFTQYCCSNNNIRLLKDFFSVAQRMIGLDEITELVNVFSYDGYSLLKYIVDGEFDCKKDVLRVLLTYHADPFKISAKSGSSLIHLLVEQRMLELFDDVVEFYEDDKGDLDSLSKLLGKKNMARVPPFASLKGRIQSESLSVDSFKKSLSQSQAKGDAAAVDSYTTLINEHEMKLSEYVQMLEKFEKAVGRLKVLKYSVDTEIENAEQVTESDQASSEDSEGEDSDL